MTNPFRKIGPRRRVFIAIWLLNIALCCMVLAFVLR